MSRGSIGLNDRLNKYIVQSHAHEHSVLAKLRILTGRMPMAGMQIAPEQGQFLAFLTRLIGARSALEIGTFTGYSALAVALALPADGRLMTCDVSDEWTRIARKHWAEAGVEAKIELRLAPALDTLAGLEREGRGDSIDIAFVDAEKTEYDDYYEHCLRLVRVGGLIVFDNMLQDGRVADPKDSDESTNAIRALNAKIATDDRVDVVLLPLGDGTTVARRAC
jgi:predicted O-methyltransferase YrrM